jgi:hypothetical protein
MLEAAMVRARIQLTEAQVEGLRALAAREGRSIAELIRTSVDSLLAGAGQVSRDERRRRALSVIGRCRRAPRDLSERHDLYLERAARK